MDCCAASVHSLIGTHHSMLVESTYQHYHEVDFHRQVTLLMIATDVSQLCVELAEVRPHRRHIMAQMGRAVYRVQIEMRRELRGEKVVQYTFLNWIFLLFNSSCNLKTGSSLTW